MKRPAQEQWAVRIPQHTLPAINISRKLDAETSVACARTAHWREGVARLEEAKSVRALVLA